MTAAEISAVSGIFIGFGGLIGGFLYKVAVEGRNGRKESDYG